MALSPLFTRFQSLPPLPTSKLGLSGAASQVRGLVHALGTCRSLQQPLLRGWEFLPLPPQPPWVFSLRGLRLYFPVLRFWVAWSVTQSTSCSFAHPASQSATSLGPPAAALPRVLSAWLPISAPLTSLGECFCLFSLVVRLPYSAILSVLVVFCF